MPYIACYAIFNSSYATFNAALETTFGSLSFITFLKNVASGSSTKNSCKYASSI
jgi:hypothetical protein